MRYIAVALTALLVSVPALAVAGGPDALSIAKRALRLAKKPPTVKHIYSSEGERGNDIIIVHARCPRGMKAISVLPDSRPYESAHITGRAAQATFLAPPTRSDHDEPAITVTCIG
jgi:hypothetical protein